MQFHLGPFPVRIHFSFFVITLILGATSGGDATSVATWLVVVFVSVLWHELGHALMGRAFGLNPVIDLHSMGGTTSWQGGRKLTPGPSILVSLAGPGAGFLFGGIVLALRLFGALPHGHLASMVVRDLIWVNVGWGVFNLIPMLPLDGGNVALAALNALTGNRGETPARIVSLLFALTLGALALRVGWLWSAILAASFAMQNGQALLRTRREREDAPLRARLEEGLRALEGGDGASAVAIAEPIVAQAKSRELRCDATRLHAFGHLLSGDWGAFARVVSDAEPGFFGLEELDKLEAGAREAKRHDVATELAAARERVRKMGLSLDK